MEENEHNYPILQSSLQWNKMDTTTQYYRVHYNGIKWTQLPNITEFITME